MKLVDHVRWHVCEGHERLFRRLPPFSLSLFVVCLSSSLVKRPRTLDHQEQEAPVCWQIREKHWNCIYRSSVSIREIRENLYSLGLSELHEELVLTGTVGRKIEEGIGWRERKGRRGDGFVVFLLFYRSFWAPLPEKGAKDLITKNDLFDDFGFESFVDRFLKAMPLRMYGDIFILATRWSRIFFIGGETFSENEFYESSDYFAHLSRRINLLNKLCTYFKFVTLN